VICGRSGARLIAGIAICAKPAVPATRKCRRVNNERDFANAAMHPPLNHCEDHGEPA
jgi:hypothetical protein